MEAASDDYLAAEIAPSNRSECRGCKVKIEREMLRVAACSTDNGRTTTPWHHLDCFYLPKKWMDRDFQPSEIRGFDKLSQELQLQLQDRIVKLKSGELKKVRQSAAKKAEDIKPEDPSKYKPGGYTEEQQAEFEDYKKEYAPFSLKQLKAMLAYNQQPQTGTKDEILQRVADGWLLGSIPKCPHCGQGKMTFNRFDGTYKCKGFFNEDSGEFQRCGRKFNRDEIEREEFA